MAESSKSNKGNKAKPKSKAKAKAKPKTASKAKAKAASKPKPKAASKAKKSTRPKSGSGAFSTNGSGPASSVKEAVKSGAQGVAPVAQKAALPLLATGAALAGAAAVIAGKNAHKQKKVLGVSVPKLPKAPKVSVPKVDVPSSKALKSDVRRATGAVTDAAERAERIGKQISRVANTVQAAGEATDKAVKKG